MARWDFLCSLISQAESIQHQDCLPYAAEADKRCSTIMSRATLLNFIPDIATVDKVGIAWKGDVGEWLERYTRYENCISSKDLTTKLTSAMDLLWRDKVSPL